MHFETRTIIVFGGHGEPGWFIQNSSSLIPLFDDLDKFESVQIFGGSLNEYLVIL